MKILVLTQYFWPENFQINDLTVSLAQKGHEVTGVPVINMVQNIFPFLGKNLEGVSFSEKLRLGVQHFESRKALKHAKRIIVTSNFVKDFLVKKLGYTRGKDTSGTFWEGSSGSRKFFTTWIAYRNALRFAIKNKSFIGILRMFLSLLNQGCNVFWTKPVDPNFKRLRRYNFIINFSFIVASCCWNLFYLAKTIRSRIYTNKLVQKVLVGAH